jgi:hypothetical protein
MSKAQSRRAGCVMWDERTAEEANIRANKAGGSWDWDSLANGFDVPDLLEWGFNKIELGIDLFPEVENQINANTTKAGQYDKTKMPVNIGRILLFMSPDEQKQYSENFGVFYSENIADNPDVQESVKKKIGKLADEIRNLI